MKLDKVTLILGLAVVLLFGFLQYKYLHFINTPESRREKNAFLSGLEVVDLRFNDFKYKAREPFQSHAPVAVVAMDDASVTEIARWPWSRTLMSEMTERVINDGAKSIAFDAIFSEPEAGQPESDAKFGKLVEAHPEQIILGTFNENEFEFAPHQDLCVAEAFLKTGGDQMVKLNPSFTVDEPQVVFDDLNWSTLFTPIFANIEEQTTQALLKDLKKTDVHALSIYQQRRLQSRIDSSYFEYCKKWLTEEDPFTTSEMLPQMKPIYAQLVAGKTDLDKLPLPELFQKIRQSYRPHPIRQYGEWTPNIPVLQVPATHTASFIAYQDPDGTVRRYPLFFRSGDKLGSSFIPSLALQSFLMAGPYRAELKLDIASDGVKYIKEFNIFDTSKNPEVKVADYPVDREGRLMIDYYGRQFSLPYVAAKEIMSDGPTIKVQQLKADYIGGRAFLVEEKEYNRKEFFKDRSLIFGATAVGLYDLRTTPLEVNYPGPEIHLSMLANLLENRFIKTWKSEEKWSPLLTVVGGILLTVFFVWGSALISFSGFAIAIAALAGFDFWLFLKRDTLVHSFTFFVTVFAIFSSIQLYKYFTEEKKKKELKSTFAKYVSPSVVDELLKDAKNLQLGGRRQHMTVFFSDVRGFTTFSETLSPTDLADLLNTYLTPMTEIVFQNGGTLDKYMGDAIMAFFGAPLSDPQHAEKACRAALKSIERLKTLNETLKEQKRPAIDIGIGLNTGDMSVGNMGSNIVQNYTVMGDAVNLGSRIEGLTKMYGVKILISEFTQAEVANKFITREADRVRVKGKSQPVRIFELMKEGKDSELEAFLELYTQAYNLYLARKFSEALSAFEKCKDARQNEMISQIYIERCQHYIETPPESDWDGVYNLKTK